MSVHVIKEEYIIGPSASDIVHLVSNSNYKIHAENGHIKLSLVELEHLGKTISKIIERDKLPIDIVKGGAQ